MIEISSKIHTEVISSNASDEHLQQLLSTANSSASNYVNINSLNLLRERSILEHISITFKITAPVYAFRALMSERYLSYYPNPGVNRIFSGKFYIPETIDESSYALIEEHCTVSYSKYKELLNEVSPELARLVLPVNTYSDMLVTLNLRETLDFLDFISITESLELKQISDQIKNILLKEIPLFYKMFLG